MGNHCCSSTAVAPNVTTCSSVRKPKQSAPEQTQRTSHSLLDRDAVVSIRSASPSVQREQVLSALASVAAAVRTNDAAVITECVDKSGALLLSILCKHDDHNVHDRVADIVTDMTAVASTHAAISRLIVTHIKKHAACVPVLSLLHYLLSRRKLNTNRQDLARELLPILHTAHLTCSSCMFPSTWSTSRPIPQLPDPPLQPSYASVIAGALSSSVKSGDRRVGSNDVRSGGHRANGRRMRNSFSTILSDSEPATTTEASVAEEKDNHPRRAVLPAHASLIVEEGDNEQAETVEDDEDSGVETSRNRRRRNRMSSDNGEFFNADAAARQPIDQPHHVPFTVPKLKLPLSSAPSAFSSSQQSSTTMRHTRRMTRRSIMASSRASILDRNGSLLPDAITYRDKRRSVLTQSNSGISDSTLLKSMDANQRLAHQSLHELHEFGEAVGHSLMASHLSKVLTYITTYGVNEADGLAIHDGTKNNSPASQKKLLLLPNNNDNNNNHNNKNSNNMIITNNQCNISFDMNNKQYLHADIFILRCMQLLYTLFSDNNNNNIDNNTIITTLTLQSICIDRLLITLPTACCDHCQSPNKLCVTNTSSQISITEQNPLSLIRSYRAHIAHVLMIASIKHSATSAFKHFSPYNLIFDDQIIPIISASQLTIPLSRSVLSSGTTAAIKLMSAQSTLTLLDIERKSSVIDGFTEIEVGCSVDETIAETANTLRALAVQLGRVHDKSDPTDICLLFEQTCAQIKLIETYSFRSACPVGLSLDTLIGENIVTATLHQTCECAVTMTVMLHACAAVLCDIIYELVRLQRIIAAMAPTRTVSVAPNKASLTLSEESRLSCACAVMRLWSLICSHRGGAAVDRLLIRILRDGLPITEELHTDTLWTNYPPQFFTATTAHSSVQLSSDRLTSNRTVNDSVRAITYSTSLMAFISQHTPIVFATSERGQMELDDDELIDQSDLVDVNISRPVIVANRITLFALIRSIAAVIQRSGYDLSVSQRVAPSDTTRVPLASERDARTSNRRSVRRLSAVAASDRTQSDRTSLDDSLSTQWFWSVVANLMRPNGAVDIVIDHTTNSDSSHAMVSAYSQCLCDILSVTSPTPSPLLSDDDFVSHLLRRQYVALIHAYHSSAALNDRTAHTCVMHLQVLITLASAPSIMYTHAKQSALRAAKAGTAVADPLPSSDRSDDENVNDPAMSAGASIHALFERLHILDFLHQQIQLEHDAYVQRIWASSAIATMTARNKRHSVVASTAAMMFRSPSSASPFEVSDMLSPPILSSHRRINSQPTAIMSNEHVTLSAYKSTTALLDDNESHDSVGFSLPYPHDDIQEETGHSDSESIADESVISSDTAMEEESAIKRTHNDVADDDKSLAVESRRCSLPAMSPLSPPRSSHVQAARTSNVASTGAVVANVKIDEDNDGEHTADDNDGDDDDGDDDDDDDDDEYDASELSAHDSAVKRSPSHKHGIAGLQIGAMSAQSDRDYPPNEEQTIEPDEAVDDSVDSAGSSSADDSDDYMSSRLSEAGSLPKVLLTRLESLHDAVAAESIKFDGQIQDATAASPSQSPTQSKGPYRLSITVPRTDTGSISAAAGEKYMTLPNAIESVSTDVDSQPTQSQFITPVPSSSPSISKSLDHRMSMTPTPTTPSAASFARDKITSFAIKPPLLQANSLPIPGRTHENMTLSPLPSSNNAAHKTNGLSIDASTPTVSQSADGYYTNQRKSHRLYSHSALHLAVVRLILRLLISSDGHTLNAAYCDRDASVDAKGKIGADVLQHMQTHLNHTAQYPLLQSLLAVDTVHRPIVRLVKLLSSALFSTNLYSQSPAIQIGRGQFAGVHLAALPGLPDRLAVKVIDQNGSTHQRCVIYDVFSECSVMEQLRGNNGVNPLIDFGLGSGQYWMIMRAANISLRSWRKQQDKPNRPPQSIPVVQSAEIPTYTDDDRLQTYLYLFGRVLIALKSLSLNDVIHFDLKCDNILIEGISSNVNEWNITLIDFGESLITIRGSDISRGTECIQSPEMLLLTQAMDSGHYAYDRRRNNHADSLSDVWSVGCLFFELITGQFLFGVNEPTVSRVTDHASDVLTPRDQAALHDNRHLIAFCRALLQRKRACRPTIHNVCSLYERMVAAMYPSGLQVKPQLPPQSISPQGTGATTSRRIAPMLNLELPTPQLMTRQISTLKPLQGADDAANDNTRLQGFHSEFQQILLAPLPSALITPHYTIIDHLHIGSRHYQCRQMNPREYFAQCRINATHFIYVPTTTGTACSYQDERIYTFSGWNDQSLALTTRKSNNGFTQRSRLPSNNIESSESFVGKRSSDKPSDHSILNAAVEYMRYVISLGGRIVVFTDANMSSGLVDQNDSDQVRALVAAYLMSVYGLTFIESMTVLDERISPQLTERSIKLRVTSTMASANTHNNAAALWALRVGPLLFAWSMTPDSTAHRNELPREYLSALTAPIETFRCLCGACLISVKSVVSSRRCLCHGGQTLTPSCPSAPLHCQWLRQRTNSIYGTYQSLTDDASEDDSAIRWSQVDTDINAIMTLRLDKAQPIQLAGRNLLDNKNKQIFECKSCLFPVVSLTTSDNALNATTNGSFTVSDAGRLLYDAKAVSSLHIVSNLSLRPANSVFLNDDVFSYDRRSVAFFAHNAKSRLIE